MTMTQPIPAPAPPASFRERALAALETHQGADLVAFVTMLHDQDVAEVVEQAVSARSAVAQIAAASAVDQQMLASVMSVVQPMLRTSAENATRAGHWSGMTEAVRSLLREADANGTAVDPESLRRVLDVPVPISPFRPQVIGFIPSTQYRVGHFRHVNTNTEWHLPFAGFQLCEDAPDRPMAAHVAFLHKGTVRPRPQLYVEHGLVMEHME
ncbi:hypothetical protein ACIRD9_42490 [Streptomyces violaceus]|uniref:hypothetical protein n=1 Tax=Streptomyces violaceus TaxID=1936 RepID=UPI00382131F9